MAEPYRAAIYYAPEHGDPLWARGCTWLGREPETGTDLAQPDVPGIAAYTSDPRRYAFHATLKPPMRPANGVDALLRDAETLANRLKSFMLPPLHVAQIGDFLALTEQSRSVELQELADACVAELDTHRLPENEAARAKRANGRTEPQLRNLERWGYPYVFAEWQFHMTLSNSIPGNPLQPSAEHYFADVLALPRKVESISVFIESEPGAPFTLLRRFRLSQ